MTFKEYQRDSRKTAIYPQEAQVIYPVLGLAGEVGELLNKLKKVYRDRRATELSIHTIPSTTLTQLEGEIGDILWYLAALCRDLRLDLDKIAESNLAKLLDRMERDKIKGEGDNR